MKPSPKHSLTWKRRLSAALLIVYWGSLFVGTHMPIPNLGGQPRHLDKLMHFGAYAGLSFLLGLWWSAGRRLNRPLALKVFAVTVVYAAVDELLQTIPFVRRTGDVLDFLADCLGSLIGLAALALWQAMLRRKSDDRE
ncbi:MAG: VanZ family protein [Planctomycetes bacterium]|nr:VanZ family protein [Planctomycetota bacterium]